MRHMRGVTPLSLHLYNGDSAEDDRGLRGAVYSGISATDASATIIGL